MNLQDLVDIVARFAPIPHALGIDDDRRAALAYAQTIRLGAVDSASWISVPELV